MQQKNDSSHMNVMLPGTKEETQGLPIIWWWDQGGRHSNQMVKAKTALAYQQT